jgi:hypothetical protein
MIDTREGGREREGVVEGLRSSSHIRDTGRLKGVMVIWEVRSDLR